MTRVIEWIISLLIVIALFVVIGLFLPASRTVSHSVETNRPMSTVNDILSSFTRFKDWNALINHDPRMQLTTSGPESGVGAALAFSSSQHSIGSGKWEIKEIVPGEKIVYALDTPGRGKNKTMTFRFERTGQRKQNVEITQRYSVDYGWDLLGRYAGTLYVNSEIGADIKRGLTKLSNLLATIPRFDYSQHPNEFQVVDVPAANVLLASATAKRSNDDIAVAMTNQMKWIEQVMEKSGLEAAGPMRIVTNEFGSDTYAFDVVLPIRRKGTGPAEASTDAEGEGTEGEAAEADLARLAANPLIKGIRRIIQFEADPEFCLRPDFVPDPDPRSGRLTLNPIAHVDPVGTLLVPGDPAASLLIQRMQVRDPHRQMPPLGTAAADAQGIALLQAWITALPPEKDT